jgi:tetratricopeptide (TPR) repeat protein
VSGGRGFLGATAVMLLLATAGCAQREQTLANRFVSQGTPAIDLGGLDPRLASRPVGSARMPAPEPVRNVGTRHSGNLSTLEATSPALQRALLALTLQPTTQRYLDVAAAYRKVDVRDRAYDYLNEGVRRDPTSAALHDALARAWRDWGMPARGLSAAHHAVYYAPRSAEARNTLGTVLWALGQRQQARQAFEDALALEPRAWYAVRNLCEVAMTEGRTKEATTLCRRATALRKASRESTTR